MWGCVMRMSISTEERQAFKKMRKLMTCHKHLHCSGMTTRNRHLANRKDRTVRHTLAAAGRWHHVSRAELQQRGPTKFQLVAELYTSNSSQSSNLQPSYSSSSPQMSHTIAQSFLLTLGCRHPLRLGGWTAAFGAVAVRVAVD